MIDGTARTVWAIRSGYKFEAVEVIKETAVMVFYRETWRNRETRQNKDNFLKWRGDEETARALVAKLTSALAEYERRRRAAGDWYSARKAEILASVDTLPKGQDAKQGLAGTESGAVGAAETPNSSPEDRQPPVSEL